MFAKLIVYALYLEQCTQSCCMAHFRCPMLQEVRGAGGSNEAAETDGRPTGEKCQPRATGNPLNHLKN